MPPFLPASFVPEAFLFSCHSQFHPFLSGPLGLDILSKRNFLSWLTSSRLDILSKRTVFAWYLAVFSRFWCASNDHKIYILSSHSSPGKIRMMCPHPCTYLVRGAPLRPRFRIEIWLLFTFFLLWSLLGWLLFCFFLGRTFLRCFLLFLQFFLFFLLLLFQLFLLRS